MYYTSDLKKKYQIKSTLLDINLKVCNLVYPKAMKKWMKRYVLQR